MTADKPSPLVPLLRFPEFRDAPAWSRSLLGSICEILNNRRVPITTNNRKAGQFPYYGASGIVDYVDDFIFSERLILVGEDGAKWGPFEQTAFIADGKYWVNNHAHVLRSVDLIDSLLEAYLVRSDLGRYVTGAAPPKLTLGKLKTIPVPIPSSPAEQQKIAGCLGSLDDLIAAQGRKLKALRQHKQGLMQQLFPQPGETMPRLRFAEFQNAGEWKLTRLSNAAQLVNDRISVSEIAKDEYVSTENILPDFSDIVPPSSFPASGSVIRFHINDLLISNIRPYLKKVWQATRSGGASNDVIVVRSKPSIDDGYLAALLKSEVFIDYVMAGAKGVKMPRGDIGLIKEYPVGIPQPAEQKKIANCLGSLDDLIAAQGRKLEALHQHKQGMLQQLFPSLEGL